MSTNLLNIGITVSDFDDDGEDVLCEMTVSDTDVIFQASAGNSGVVITGAPGDEIELEGTIRELDDFFRGQTTGTLALAVTGAVGPTIELTISVTDSDDNVGMISFEGSVSQTVAPTVTADVASYNATPGVWEDISDAFSIVWQGHQFCSLVLSAERGIIRVDAGTSGVSVQYGNISSTVTITGEYEHLDALFAGGGTVQYEPVDSFDDTVTATVTAANGLTDAATTIINMVVAPVVLAPNPVDIAVANGVAKDLDGSGTLFFRWTDADEEVGDIVTVRVSIPAASGILNVTQGDSPCTITTIIGSRSHDISGTLAQVRAFMLGSTTGTITYLHSVNGTYVLTCMVTDEDGQSDSETCNLVVS